MRSPNTVGTPGDIHAGERTSQQNKVTVFLDQQID